MVVQHNLSAMNANRQFGIVNKTLAGSTEKLSSGYRINRAADDAAGLSISEKMRKQIRGLSQASSNAEDGISCVQTAEGALQEVTDMLQRMNELAVQAANGTNSTTDRGYIQDELDQLVTEIDRVAETSKFNETYLIKGDKTQGTTKAYTAVYTVTYTINKGTNYGLGGNTNNAGVPYKVKYMGHENVYVAKAEDIYNTNANKKATVDLVQKGSDVTKYLTSEYIGKNGHLIGGYKDESYGMFKNEDASKLTISDGDTTALTLTDDGKIVASATSIANEMADAYFYDTETNTIFRIAAGEDLSKYMSVEKFENNMQVKMNDRYRLLEEVKLDKHANGSDCVVDSHGTSTGKPTKGMSLASNADSDNNDNDRKDIKIQEDLILDQSPRQLYDADGKEVSAIALRKYIDEKGVYKGGLYTTSQATQELEADDVKDYFYTVSGDVADPLTFSLHVGADSDRSNKIYAKINSMSAAGLGLNAIKSSVIGVVDETGANATDAIDVIADALQKVSTQRSSLGAIQNRLEHTIKNLDNVVENTQSAESAIRDTDMATEAVKHANANVLAQAGQSMLAQANQSNQGVLSLLS